jgi:hypothetical protein
MDENMKVAQNHQKQKGTPRPTYIGNTFALGNKGGRPREWDEEVIAIEEKALREWIKNPKNYFLTSFLNQRLTWKQLIRFSEYSEEFCHTLERARLVQEACLVDLAVSRKGDVDSSSSFCRTRLGGERNLKY